AHLQRESTFSLEGLGHVTDGALDTQGSVHRPAGTIFVRERRIGKINGIFAPVSAGAPRRRPHPLDAAAPLGPPTCACRGRAGEVGGAAPGYAGGAGVGTAGGWQAGEGGWHTGVPRLSTHIADGTPRGGGLVEREYLLAHTGRGNGRWDGRELEMPQDTRH